MSWLLTDIGIEGTLSVDDPIDDHSDAFALRLSGFPGCGIGLLHSAQQGGCAEALCQVEPIAAQPAMEMSCYALSEAFGQSEAPDETGSETAGSNYCLMSGGP